MTTKYAVALCTMGSFHGWASDPMDSLDEAELFVANPPSVWSPRPQDRLVIFELAEVFESTEAYA